MRIVDPPEDPPAEGGTLKEEEEEYQAWKERRIRERAERQQRIDSREGLIRLDDRPQAQAWLAMRRSLPGFGSARRLFERVRQRLGDQAELDAWAAPGERCLLLQDPEHPGWLLPQRFLYLRAKDPSGEQVHGPVVHMSVHAPPQLKRFAERFREEVLDPELPPPRNRDEPPTLPDGSGPGTLQLHEGPANLTMDFGDDGTVSSCGCTAGDMYAFAEPDSQPFTIDPFVRPPQVPPPGLMVDPRLEPQGVDLETLADLVLASRPLDHHHGRVMVPCDQPGTVQGTWGRARSTLRQAAWEGRLPDGPGWVVVDGWNGSALVVGDSFEEAVAAWKEQVERVQPLPPVEGPSPPPDEPDEPEDDGVDDDVDDDEDDAVVQLPKPLPDNVAIASSGPIEIRMLPPVQMHWPPPRPENVSAAAVPLPATPSIPPQLAALGFHRVLHLFGEQGEVGFSFLRTDPDGYTAIGDDAWPALELERLEEDLDALLDKQIEEHVDVWGKGNPYVRSEYPVMQLSYHVRDGLGRQPELREAGTSWGNADSLRGWDVGHRHLVVRVRIRK